jgi:hypothetical protein
VRAGGARWGVGVVGSPARAMPLYLCPSARPSAESATRPVVLLNALEREKNNVPRSSPHATPSRHAIPSRRASPSRRAPLLVGLLPKDRNARRKFLSIALRHHLPLQQGLWLCLDEEGQHYD